MSAVGRNILKFIGGSAIGAGIGALFARGTETATQQGPPAGALAAHDSLSDRATDAKIEAEAAVEEKKESIKERWERAKAEGDAAKEAREAELRSYFREKVSDPTAFPPGAPTRSDT